MGERVIKPKFNIYESYKKMNISNPYRFGVPVVVDGLVSYYNLETDALDNYGTNHGTNNGVTFLNGEAIFNGSSDISLPANLFSSPTELSLSLFVRTDDNTREHRCLTINNNTGAPYISVRINRSGVANTVGVSWNQTNNKLHVVSIPSSTTKFHLGFTLQKTGIYEIYINGAKVVEGATDGTFTQIPDFPSNRIGTARNGTVNATTLKGKMSKIGLYNKILTPAEYVNLYNNGNGILL